MARYPLYILPILLLFDTIWCIEKDRPTILPEKNFNSSADVLILSDALNDISRGSDEIIEVLGRKPFHQRSEIVKKYQELHSKDLAQELSTKLNGNFKKCLLDLITPLPYYLAQELGRAIHPLGTKEHVLNEILGSSSNTKIKEIKEAYKFLFGTSLENHIKGDTSGDYKRLLLLLASHKRDETNTDPSVASGLAQRLYKAGQKIWGTNEAEFNKIMTSYSYPILRNVFQEYTKLFRKSFKEAIISETSGDYEECLLDLYSIINNRAKFFAIRLNVALNHRFSVDDLIRVLISRSEIDLGNITEEYKKLRGENLKDTITRKTMGEFRRLLLALINE